MLCTCVYNVCTVEPFLWRKKRTISYLFLLSIIVLPYLFISVVVQPKHGARHILAKAQVACGWMRCVAQAMSSLWSSAQKVRGENTTVCTRRMRECLATPLQVFHHSWRTCDTCNEVEVWSCLKMLSLISFLCKMNQERDLILIFEVKRCTLYVGEEVWKN